MQAVHAANGQIEIREIDEPIAGPGQLLIAVKAAGLNAADRLIVNGTYVSGTSTRTPTTTAASSIPLGAEAAGEVVGIGEGVDGFALGDRVMGVSGAAFAPLALVGAPFAMHIPEALSYEEAAAVPVAFATAHDALLSAGSTHKGDNVLVTAASSGVGVAALQLARLFGARIVGASSRSSSKLAALAEVFETDVSIVTDDPGLAERSMRATDDHGFDVIIDQVGASALPANVAVAAIKGRIVSVGRMGGTDGAIDLDELARKRLALIGVTFRSRTAEEIVDVYAHAATDIIPAFSAGRLRVIVDREFPFPELAAAQHWLQTSRTIGKVVLTFP
jgi:NADPH2:quinone reductase